MSRCPDDAELQAFIAGVQSPSETAAMESHVEVCVRCQRRMDVLADVTSVGAVLANATRSRVESSSLMLVMERLQLEVTSLLDTPIDGRAGLTLLTQLPGLAPATREGFLGKLGSIDIHRVIGRGGMGVVFEGVDPTLNRTVAVKVLSPHLVADPVAKERFLREAQAAAALSHVNVVAIHSIEHTADGIPFLVLQYVAGESLADRLAREQKLKPDEVARIGTAVARGLAAAHACGLVHRDIKPANVLLEYDTGRVLLTDFGLAKVASGETITGVGTVAGTPAFMSPEQAAGGDVDSRSDLFSLGSLLYTATSGRLPFSGDSPFVVLDRIRNGSQKPLAELDPSVPKWLSSVVQRLLEKDPARRIQTAAELADLLEQKTTVPTNHSRRWQLVGLTVLIALLTVAVTVAVIYALRPPSTPQLLPTFRETEISIAGRAERWAKLADAVAAAADDDVIIVHGDGPHTSSRIDIHRKRLTIRAADGAHPVFTPDGTTRSTQWLTSDSDLTIEGMTIEWPGRVGDTDPVPFSTENAVVLGNALLTVRHCRIVSGPRMASVAGTGPTLIDDCYLTSDRNGGACVAWKAAGSLTVERTFMEGRNGVAIAGGAKELPVKLIDCTFQTDSALMFFAFRQATTALPTNVRRCLFDTNNVFTLYYVPAYPIGGRPTADELRTALTRTTTWTEAENIYRRGASFATAWARGRPQSPGDIRTAAEWLSFWKQPDAKSIDGELRFVTVMDADKNEPPQLEAIEDPSGTVPAWATMRK